MANFPWIPLYRELATRILDYHPRTPCAVESPHGALVGRRRRCEIRYVELFGRPVVS